MAEKQLTLPLGKIKRACKVDGCEKPKRCWGYCARHAQQIKDKGKIFGNPTRSQKDPNEFVIEDTVCRIQLYDYHGWKIAETIIDSKDYKKCKQYRWYLHNDKYAATRKTRTFLHRLIMDDVPRKGLEIDHIDRDPLNNRHSNLRWVTRTQNKQNVNKSKSNTSGFKGVYWHKKDRKWMSQIVINGKWKYLGSYDSKIIASIAYNKAASKYFGEYANLNKISGESQ